MPVPLALGHSDMQMPGCPHEAPSPKRGELATLERSGDDLVAQRLFDRLFPAPTRQAPTALADAEAGATPGKQSNLPAAPASQARTRAAEVGSRCPLSR